MDHVVLTVLAHPDDAEFLCGGALVRLRREHDWHVHIASMTPGDCGSAEFSADEISRMRRAEGAAAAAVIGGAYHCAEQRDLLVMYNERCLKTITRLLRIVRPSVVITHSPDDYHLDHEMTSKIVRAATFAAPVPLFDPGKLLPLEHIPHLYYCDAIEGKNAMGEDIPPHFYTDISRVIEVKSQMLAAHVSQRNWLIKHHGMDNYIQSMKDWSAHRGRERGVAFAEGFRQHLGHSYPQDNLLGKVLGAI
jgi:LmbE family N-acetylglucosaminyl deacetylase